MVAAVVETVEKKAINPFRLFIKPITSRFFAESHHANTLRNNFLAYSQICLKNAQIAPYRPFSPYR